MKLHAEVFFTKIENSEVIYFRDHLDLSYKSKDPDLYVIKVVENYAHKLKAEPGELIIHSTSWRCDSVNLIVLTYIVYSDYLDFSTKKAKKIEVEDLRIATSEDVNKPKPVEISELHIVSHGLRHVSYLVKNDPLFKKRLKAETIGVFKEIDAVLAGKITS